MEVSISLGQLKICVDRFCYRTCATGVNSSLLGRSPKVSTSSRMSKRFSDAGVMNKIESPVSSVAAVGVRRLISSVPFSDLSVLRRTVQGWWCSHGIPFPRAVCCPILQRRRAANYKLSAQPEI